jgi:hypothetical protein
VHPKPHRAGQRAGWISWQRGAAKDGGESVRGQERDPQRRQGLRQVPEPAQRPHRGRQRYAGGDAAQDTNRDRGAQAEQAAVTEQVSHVGAG